MFIFREHEDKLSDFNTSTELTNTLSNYKLLKYDPAPLF